MTYTMKPAYLGGASWREYVSWDAPVNILKRKD